MSTRTNIFFKKNENIILGESETESYEMWKLLL